MAHHQIAVDERLGDRGAVHAGEDVHQVSACLIPFLDVSAIDAARAVEDFDRAALRDLAAIDPPGLRRVSLAVVDVLSTASAYRLENVL